MFILACPFCTLFSSFPDEFWHVPRWWSAYFPAIIHCLFIIYICCFFIDKLSMGFFAGFNFVHCNCSHDNGADRLNLWKSRLIGLSNIICLTTMSRQCYEVRESENWWCGHLIFSLALWPVCLLPWDVRCLRVLNISALLCKHQREFPSWTRRYHDTNTCSFIWRQDSSQMYFILFMFGIFQAQDADGGEQTWEIEVYSASGLMCIWHQDREELVHLVTRKTWVLFIGF